MPKQKSTRFNQIVIDHLLRVKGDLVIAVICIVGSTLTALLVPWPLKLIFDHLLLSHPLSPWMEPAKDWIFGGSNKGLFILCGAMVAIALLKGLFAYYQLFLTSRVGYLLVYTLRGQLFDHLQQLSLSFHHKTRSGELLSKLTSDTNTLKDVYADSALTFTTHVLTIGGMVAVMFTLNVKLSLVVLVSFPILFAAIYSIYSRVKLTARSQRRNDGHLASRVAEILNAVPLIQAFGTQDYERERFDYDSTQSMRESIRISRMEAAATRLVEIVSALGTAVVVLVGCLQVFDGRMSPGDVLVFAAYIGQMYQPVRQIARLSTRFSRAAVSIERISEILDTVPEIQDRPNAIVPGKIRGEVEFDHVTFAYPDGKTILDDVSFRIAAGERVALVGASGAGKSSIARLLIRLYDPQQGAIRVDGTDIRDYQRKGLLDATGVVLQDSILFGTTIRENIAYGRPEATQEQIEDAARQVHAHDFISELPDGYDTVLGESGGTLSGGQRQRLCLARALVRQASILILDEPTSAVDAESQALIRDALQQIQHGRDRTILLIAHQFNVIRDFDRILVLKNGVIAEQGNHESLLALNGHYRELFRLQGGLRVA